MEADKKSENNIKQFRKKEAFKLPNNYFEDFNYQMQLKISANSPKVSLFDRFLYMLRLRFMVPFILVCLISSIAIQLDLSTKKVVLSDNAIENYLLNELQYAQIEDFTDLAELNIEYSSAMIEDTEILEYLQNIELEDELIYNQFN